MICYLNILQKKKKKLILKYKGFLKVMIIENISIKEDDKIQKSGRYITKGYWLLVKYKIKKGKGSHLGLYLSKVRVILIPLH